MGTGSFGLIVGLCGMSEIHINRIKNLMRKLFEHEIDMVDYNKKPDQKEKAFLSRAVAGYALTIMADIKPAEAAKSITDGYDDNGIDALHFDKLSNVFYLVASKWIGDGKGSITQTECQKLLTGFEDLVNLRKNHFNKHIRGRFAEIEAALYNANVNFVLIFSHTGTGSASIHVKRLIKQFLDEINNPEKVASVEIFDQKRFYTSLTRYTEGRSIDFDIPMLNWGSIKDPYLAYYGQVDVGTIANWWDRYGHGLFSKDIRYFKGKTDVNEGLSETLRKSPENFLYFNNGITILCSSINKKAIGGASREMGMFECKGVNIVNGAQTVGTIGTLKQDLRHTHENAKVMVRIISLENCPEGFDRDVTRATNTQNRIEGRDFAALDPNQQRLASELLLDGKEYVYKSGAEETKGTNCCNIVESTVALACANEDVALAVQAKRGIGRLWENLKQPPYTKLFNDHTSAVELWRAVEIMRMVDLILFNLQKTYKEKFPRADMAAIHGNRLILHCVFMDSKMRGFREERLYFEEIKGRVENVTNKIFGSLIEILERDFERTYLATLFKNTNKCRTIIDKLFGKKTLVENKTDGMGRAAGQMKFSFTVEKEVKK